MANTQVAINQFSIELQLTYRCNLRCRHCYLLELVSNTPIDMDKEVAKDIIRQFNENKEITKYASGKIVILSGGEALLHPHFKEIYEYLLSMGDLDPYILTNGVLVDKFIDVIGNPRTTVQVSLDGTREHHNWLRNANIYDKVVDNIKLLKKANARVHIKSVIHRYNKHDWMHILELASKLDVDAVSFNFFVKSRYNNVDLGLSIKEIREIMDVLKSISIFYNRIDFPYSYSKCYAGVFHISVTPDGTYLDCPITNNVLGKYPQRLDEILDYEAMKMRKGRYPPCLPK